MSLMILSHEKEATLDPNFTIMTKLEKIDIFIHDFIHDYIIMTEFEKILIFPQRAQTGCSF